MNDFFAYVNRLKYIERWGLMRRTESENLWEHSFQTAVLAHCLALIAKNELGKKADEKNRKNKAFQADLAFHSARRCCIRFHCQYLHARKKFSLDLALRIQYTISVSISKTLFKHGRHAEISFIGGTIFAKISGTRQGG